MRRIHRYRHCQTSLIESLESRQLLSSGPVFMNAAQASAMNAFHRNLFLNGGTIYVTPITSVAKFTSGSNGYAGATAILSGSSGGVTIGSSATTSGTLRISGNTTVIPSILTNTSVGVATLKNAPAAGTAGTISLNGTTSGTISGSLTQNDAGTLNLSNTIGGGSGTFDSTLTLSSAVTSGSVTTAGSGSLMLANPFPSSFTGTLHVNAADGTVVTFECQNATVTTVHNDPATTGGPVILQNDGTTLVVQYQGNTTTVTNSAT